MSNNKHISYPPPPQTALLPLWPPSPPAPSLKTQCQHLSPHGKRTKTRANTTCSRIFFTFQRSH